MSVRSARGAGVLAGLLVVVVVLGMLALSLGDYPLSPLQVVRALVTGDGFAGTIVRDWRAPRVVAAICFGAALALSGAIFQSLTDNPLGSPDVIGFTTGSYTGVIVAVTVLGARAGATTAGALTGGIVTALGVYLLAYRRGIQGFRLIIVGVGVTAMLTAFNSWLLLRTRTELAMTLSMWGAGSLELVKWSTVLPAVLVLLAGLAALGALTPHMRQLELGDDAAASHGVRLEATRLALIVVGMVLVAAVTAVCGPIGFVALVSPQIARALRAGAGPPLADTALVGSVILLTADLAAQYALPAVLPAGVVTIVFGGGYLLWMLTARNT
ncbi:FecCD family ABC transporter permease [Propionibacterium australiense]|uniref:TM_ABC_iron-siderophores_like n=2 Tax=Propionibacterium australiense TaxID=119981 RepID=A0A383S3B4_9ACTN|nr:iron chelate uptake ABC transporter family permease subunit [Propionibacterium australiense]SYZ32495.1 TM_ABC_iron-siderophores_like [Propionibacterium australiense]VEH90100.1 Ferric enterobactin transport system permease protein fepG [Propionibacterium australiense]